MAKSTVSLPILSMCFVLLFLNPAVPFYAGMDLKLAEGFEATSWCVAKPSSSDAELTTNIEYACNNLPDCSLIQEGGPCFNPNTLINHASVVMNQYYASMGRNNWDCDFKKSGLIVDIDPSYNSCTYA